MFEKLNNVSGLGIGRWSGGERIAAAAGLVGLAVHSQDHQGESQNGSEQHLGSGSGTNGAVILPGMISIEILAGYLWTGSA